MNTVEYTDILHIVDIVTKTPIESEVKEISQSDEKHNGYIKSLFGNNILSRKVGIDKISDVWYFVESWTYSQNDEVKINKISPLGPARFELLSIKDKLFILNEFLVKAVDIESYEEAAIIRDKINSIK